MKLSNFKLAGQLAIGFGAIIVITLALGTLATTNMFSASKLSAGMSEKYVPATAVANEIERSSLQTMYAMRAYAYTQEQHYWDEGMNNLNLVKRHLKNALELAKSQNLSVLEEQANIANENLLNYESLAKQTQEANKNLENYVSQMNGYAAEFVENCTTFLAEQHQRLQQDIASGASKTVLREREQKIYIVNEIVDKGNFLRIANFQAQALRDPERFQNAVKSFDISRELASARAITHASNNKLQLDKIEQSANSYTTAMTSYLATWFEREKLNSERNDVANKVLAAAQETAQTEIKLIEDNSSTMNSNLSTASMITIVGLIIAIVLAAGMAIVITRNIVSGITGGVNLAQVIANGDLTAEIDQQFIARKDEVGQLAKALQNMVDKLKEVIGSVMLGSDNIAAASMQMSSGSQQVSQGASEQASSAEEVSSSMEEMAANIQQNTDNAQEADKISQKVQQGVQKVGAASQDSLISIKDIAEKINIINDIAFQTNILALNAAVEAARAGEQGRGFAVVAAEVRKLAERSKIAADEIVALASKSVNVTENASELMSGLIPEIERTAKLVQEIAAASMEQTSGADQVNTAIQQLNQVTQQNAAASEEMATSAEELSSQAEQLKEIIGYFRIDSRRNNKFRAENHLAPKPAATPKIQQTSNGKAKGVNINLNNGNGASQYQEIKSKAVAANGDSEFENF